MQRTPDGTLLFSPSDLVEFMESPFASWMSRYALDQPGVKPARDAGDPLALPGAEELLQRRGLEHERRVLGALEAAGRDVAALDPKAADALARTLAALRAGREVIYQATLAPAARCTRSRATPRRRCSRTSGSGPAQGVPAQGGPVQGHPAESGASERDASTSGASGCRHGFEDESTTLPCLTPFIPIR